ncbi:MAG: hypothetical protein KAI69_03285, partial [Deltaproteobacteria bacterium]|nr:hypothetical protein [Deltaproteobacteria bacterium]
VELVEMVELAYLHVFPYSPRRGTVAATWPDRISSTEKKARAKKLGALGRHKKDVFSRKNLGNNLKVLLETRVDDIRYGAGWFGHSRNYLPVMVINQSENNCLRAGSEVTVQAQDWDGRRLIAVSHPVTFYEGIKVLATYQ